jgi:hypothetical protein
VLADSTGKPVRLKNNPQAIDVSWGQVKEFVHANHVNEHPYQLGAFVCTEFAVALHDAAEVRGLRCGLVYVTFTQGDAHTLNVFQTTDLGPVYVDCTGGDSGNISRTDYDTVGYLEKGKTYGRLPLDIAAENPNHYAHYMAITNRWGELRREQKETQNKQQVLLASFHQWETESQQLKALTKNPVPPEKQREYSARITALNQKAASINQQQNALNRQIQTLNDEMKRLQCRYQMNEAPVVSIDIWWGEDTRK